MSMLLRRYHKPKETTENEVVVEVVEDKKEIEVGTEKKKSTAKKK